MSRAVTIAIAWVEQGVVRFVADQSQYVSQLRTRPQRDRSRSNPPPRQ